MVRLLHQLALPALMVVTVVALAACGATAPAAQNPPATSQPVAVKVTLSEMKIDSSLTTFQTGAPYHFEVTNVGATGHEFMIMPVVPGGGMTMTEMDKMALAMIEEDDLPPGTTRTLDFTFSKPSPAGQLEFACHQPGHYEAGMHVPIVVQ